MTAPLVLQISEAIGPVKPRIHVYTICWNEVRMLPYFLRHYERIARRIIVYDNGSDDGSQTLVEAHPRAVLRRFDSGGESREDLEIDIKNNAWKESRAQCDWVIVCDVDELLYHPHLFDYLKSCRAESVSIPVPAGYQMVADKFPTTRGQIYEEVRHGFPDPRQSKLALFNPHAVQEIQFTPGCHSATPLGDCRLDRSENLKLLHFKFLGLEWLSTRYRELGARKSEFDRQHHYGHHYFVSEANLAAKFASYRKRAYDIFEGKGEPTSSGCL